MRKPLLIEPCNFVDSPKGGQLTSSRHLMSAFGNTFALVGFSTDDAPVGKWMKRTIDGVEYDFFSIYRCGSSSSRPFIPARMRVLISLIRHRRSIRSRSDLAFVQSQETLLVTSQWNFRSLCYCFPGIENPLRISRYAWAKALSGLFDRLFLRAVARADTVLAAADYDAIRSLAERSHGGLNADRIHSFPTRVDRNVFQPAPMLRARASLKLPLEPTIWVTTGRIHWAKGWELLLNAFISFRRVQPESMLIFVGDGEDRPRLEAAIQNMGLAGRVLISGFAESHRVACYLQSANVFVLGSEKEGWSTSLVEALACGCRIVSTNVSSASDIVKNGVTGRVTPTRDPDLFAQAVKEVLEYPDNQVSEHSEHAVTRFDLASLKSDLLGLWPALQESVQ